MFLVQQYVSHGQWGTIFFSYVLYDLQNLCEDCPVSRSMLVLYEVGLSMQRLLIDLEPDLTTQEWNDLVEVLKYSYECLGTWPDF